MSDALAHRGPDSFGSWVSAPTAIPSSDQPLGVALGHRRLAILDLTPEGAQPMHSVSGRYALTFNGEIYNFAELRSDLERRGATFRGTSDTEVILAAFEAYGVAATLPRLVGMFAIAVWDNKDHALTLARDRFGEKPLYYGWRQGYFMFASELSAMEASPVGAGEIFRDALTGIVRLSYIAAPHSVYRDFFKAPIGSYLTLKGAALTVPPSGFSPRADSARNSPTSYWSLKQAVTAAKADPFSGSETEAITEVHRILSRAVYDQMIADVPVGAFLSGGIDSSTVVALMQEHSTRPVKTFSIGFHETKFNEATFAKQIAAHIGTDHTEYYVSAKEAQDTIPLLPKYYSEPFADSSQIPTLLVSKIARTQVTVSLSGDGGDELFGGYSRYQWANRLWNVTRSVSPRLRKPFGYIMTKMSPAHWNALFSPLMHLVPNRFHIQNPGGKFWKAASLLQSTDDAQLYYKLISQCQEPEHLLPRTTEPYNPHLDTSLYPAGLSPLESMLFTDAITYLPDDILVKLDRAAMSVSLEGRVPLLDHRLTEFVWRLPPALRLKSIGSKYPLRQILYRYVPQKLVDRPKQGFAIPLGSWLTGPLRPWAEELLRPETLRADGYFDEASVTRLWREHLTGQRNHEYVLWDILMLQGWLHRHS